MFDEELLIGYIVNDGMDFVLALNSKNACSLLILLLFLLTFSISFGLGLRLNELMQ